MPNGRQGEEKKAGGVEVADGHREGQGHRDHHPGSVLPQAGGGPLALSQGRPDIGPPACRNPKPVGYLSAMLCKACVVALRGEVIGITTLEPHANVSVQSRSQSGTHNNKC